CSKTFRSRETYELHMNKHTSTGRFKCPIQGCNITYLQEKIPERHLRTHESNKP
ncbi:hypothetical protein BDK51DRAFT_2032, partial [Blyttiomyces helicus]